MVMRGDEFQCDETENIVHCNRIDDLFNAIINAKIQEPVYIGISVGFSPNQKTYQQVNMLNKSIDDLISRLNNMGVVATKLDLKNEHIFILDTINGGIITPANQNIKESAKAK